MGLCASSAVQVIELENVDIQYLNDGAKLFLSGSKGANRYYFVCDRKANKLRTAHRGVTHADCILVEYEYLKRDPSMRNLYVLHNVGTFGNVVG